MMLGFKESQTAQPILDYYNETDLDTIDDQPVDYSKKYTDQDSEETCVSRNKRHPPNTENIDNSKTPYDELKVYCIEGTPLIISSASSMSDLRDLGTNPNENFKLLEEKDPSFQNVTEVPTTKDNVKAEDKSEEFDNNSTKNISENASSRNEENCSKVSSPLMFSRSSSVGSLNSFDVHSIVDDRSSVSVFSTLTSGLISPSDIPDSPGEAMSPFIHKNKFSFPNSCNEKSSDPILANFKDNSTENFDNVFDDIPEDNVKVYEDEGDFSSVSNFSALTHHTTHTSSSRMSFTVLRNETIANLEHVSTVKIKYSIKSSEVSASKNCDANETNILHQESINCDSSFADFNVQSVRHHTEEVRDSTSKQETLNEVEPTYSDDESDDLLDQCILLGKPESKKASITLNKSPIASPVHCRVQEESSDKDCTTAYCEDDASDDDLLEDCIQRGRPQSVKSALIQNEDMNSSKLSSCISNSISQSCMNPPVKDSSNQKYPSLSDKPFQDKSKCLAQTSCKAFSENKVSNNDLLEDCIQLGRPQSVKCVYRDDQIVNPKILPSSTTKNCISQSPQKKSLNSPSFQVHPHYCNKLVQNFKKQGVSQSPNTTQSQPLRHQKSTMKQSDHKEPYDSVTSRGFSPLDKNPLKGDTTAYCESDASDDDLLEDCIQRGRPQSVKSVTIQIRDANSSKSSSPMKKPVKDSPNQMYTSQSDKHVQNFKRSRVNPTPSTTHSPPVKYPKNSVKQYDQKETNDSEASRSFSPLGYRDNIPDGTSDVEEEDDDDDILTECIRAGKMVGKTPDVKSSLPSPSAKLLPAKTAPQKKSSLKEDKTLLQRKPNYFSQRRLFDFDYLRAGCVSPPMMDIDDSMCVYRTEDTPLLSPTASISDLSTLSFSEDKVERENYRNNSRNSDCSSESEDDELLLQCIQSGMPGNKRAVG